MDAFGWQLLALNILDGAYIGLSKRKDSSAFADSLFFYESGSYFSLICQLAGADEDEEMEKFRRITGRRKVRTGGNWLERGEIGIFKDNRLISVVRNAAAACDVTGLSYPTIYKLAKSGRVSRNGYRIMKRVKTRRKGGRKPRLIIEIDDGTVKRRTVGIKSASHITGLSTSQVVSALKAGSRGQLVIRRVGVKRGRHAGGSHGNGKR